MPIITSTTHSVQSGSTNSGEFAINGLPIQLQATGNTIGDDLEFNGSGLALGPDAPATGSVTGIQVNGGPVQSNISNGILQLATPKGTITGVELNGVAGDINLFTGVVSLSLALPTGTVTAINHNGVMKTPINGVITLETASVTGARINGGSLVQPVNGVLNLNGVGSVNAINYGGQIYNSTNGVVTLPQLEASVGVVKSVSINGGSGVIPDGDGLVNLGNVGTVRRVSVNGIQGDFNATTGEVSLNIPTGGVNTVSVDGGTPVSAINGNINLTGIGTVKTVRVNNNIFTANNGEVNLGRLGTLSSLVVNNITANVDANGNATVSIPTGTGTVTGIQINGGVVQQPSNGVVNLSIPTVTDVVKTITVGGQVLSPVNGNITLVLPATSTGTVRSVSVNGTTPVQADGQGNIALDNIGTTTGVQVNGGATVSSVNGIVSLTGIGTVSGVTVNGGSVQTPTNGRVNLTGVGRVNRVIVNSVEANVSADGTATVNIPVDDLAVKTISVNGGSPQPPVNGNVNLVLPVSQSSLDGVTGVTVNGGAKISPVANVINLTGIGTVSHIRLNGELKTPTNGEVVLNAGTVNTISVNGGAPQAAVNGNVDITVQAAQPGAQSVSINGGAPVNVVNGNIALNGIGTVTGATVNGGATIAASNGRLNLTNIGTVTAINYGGQNYTASNGVVTLPGAVATGPSGVQTISLNGGDTVAPTNGNINLLVGTLTGVTVNGVLGTVSNGRADVNIAMPVVPVKGITMDGSPVSPNGQGIVNLSLSGLARSVSFLGETQTASASGAITLPSTVGTVKALTINGGAQIAPVNGVVNLVLPSGQTSGIQTLVVNGQQVSPNNGVATFSTPQGTVTGITLNGSPVQQPVNGVVALSLAATNSGVQSISVNGSTVSRNPTTGNVDLDMLVSGVTVNGGVVQTPTNGRLNITTPTNFVRTVQVNGGSTQSPDAITGNLNITVPIPASSGVQAVRINGGSAVYPTNGIVDLSITAATNYVKSVVINGVSGSPDPSTGVVNISIPAGDSNVKSVSINGGTRYQSTSDGNIDISAVLGAGTVTGIQVNGGSIVSPNASGILSVNVGTVTGATVNGGAVVTASSGRLNLTNIGTISAIIANGQNYSPVGGGNTVNLGTLGTVNSVTVNGGAPITANSGNIALTGVGNVTGATVNGGSLVSAVNGVLNLTVPAASGGGGVQAVSVNNGTPQYPQGGVVNLTISGGQGTVTGATVNGGSVINAVNGVLDITGVGTVTGATVNGGSVVTAANGRLNLTNIGTVTGVTFNGGLIQTPTNGVVALTYAPNDVVKSVIVNGGSPQTPVNGVLSLTIATGSTAPPSSGNVKSISVNGALALSADTSGLVSLNVGTVKGVRHSGGSIIYPDPSTGVVDLGTITSTGSTAPASPFPTQLQYTSGDSTLRLTLNNGTVYTTTIVAGTSGSTGPVVTDELYVFTPNMSVTQGKYYHDNTGIYRRLGVTAQATAINAADTANWLLVASVDQYLRSRAERISAQGIRTLHDTLAAALSGATSGDTVIQNAAVSDTTIFGNSEQVRVNANTNFRSNGLDIGKEYLPIESAPPYTQGDCLTIVGGKGVIHGGGAHVYNNTNGSWAFGNYGQGVYNYDIIDYHIHTFSGEAFSLRGQNANVRFINGSFDMSPNGNNQNGAMLRDGASMEIINAQITGRGNNHLFYVSQNSTLTITDTNISKNDNVRIEVAAGGTLIMRDCIIKCQGVNGITPVIEAMAGSEVYLYNVQMETWEGNGVVAIETPYSSGATSYVEAWGETYLNGSVANDVDIYYYNSPAERITEGPMPSGGVIDFATRYQETVVEFGGIDFTRFTNAKLGARVRLTVNSLNNENTLTGWVNFNSSYNAIWSQTGATNDSNGSYENIIVHQTGFSFQPGVSNFIDIECVGMQPVKRFEVSFIPGPVARNGVIVFPGGGGNNDGGAS